MYIKKGHLLKTMINHERLFKTMRKHCILLETETRDKLKKIGTKSQTYDSIINELIKSKYSSSTGCFLKND